MLLRVRGTEARARRPRVTLVRFKQVIRPQERCFPRIQQMLKDIVPSTMPRWLPFIHTQFYLCSTSEPTSCAMRCRVISMLLNIVALLSSSLGMLMTERPQERSPPLEWSIRPP